MPASLDIRGRKGTVPLPARRDGPPRVFIIGIGRLGIQVLNGLVSLAPDIEIIAAGPRRSALQTRVNVVTLAAMHVRARLPSVTPLALDLLEVEQAAEILAAQHPDIVVHCATLHPYAATAQLPPVMRDRLMTAGLGPWLPGHLALTERLMKALELADVSPVVINCAYPDAVNAALATVGPFPILGAGNLANNEPALRRAIGDLTATEVSDVSIEMIMHHYVSHRIHRCGDAGGAPFFLSYTINNHIGDQVAPIDSIFGQLASRYRRDVGGENRLIPAASTVALVASLLSDATRRLHAPGVNGHIGGYPIRVSCHELAVVLPEGVTTKAAEAINVTAQRFDGIDAITSAGEVIFTPEATEIFAEVIGHTCAGFRVPEAYEWTQELYAHCCESADG